MTARYQTLLFSEGCRLDRGNVARRYTAGQGQGTLSKGNAAILPFLAAAELIETDPREQYNELGGVNGGTSARILALQDLDGDMPQYISDNTDGGMLMPPARLKSHCRIRAEITVGENPEVA